MEKTRHTKQKQLILDILNTARTPVTASELYRLAVQSCPTIAKSTVYRNLDAMASRGEVERGFLENGESFFSVSAEKHHHHYMICRSCNKMQDMPACPMGDLERELEDRSGFVTTDHVVQVYGYCKECAAKQKKI